MKSKRRSFQRVLGAGCTLAAILIAAAAWLTSYYLDDMAVRTESRVATYEINDIYENLQGRLIARAYRDNTYSHVVRRWDQQWIDREMTNYLPSLGIYRVAILDREGQAEFIGQNWGRVRNAPAMLAEGRGMAALLQAAGRAPKVSRGMVVVGGKPYFAVASEIQPVEEPPNAGLRPRLLVFFQPAEKKLFHALMIGFRAEDVQVTLQERAWSRSRVSLAMKDAAGMPQAYLSWQSLRPGTNFFWIVLPVMSVIFALLITLLLYFAGRWQKAQAQLLATRAHDLAMQEEIRVKAIFIGNISHELRTPLNAILGFAEMLQMQVFGALGSVRYKEYVDHIISSGHELLRMVNDLIEIARIRAKDTAREREPIDAAACLRGVMAASQGFAEKKRVNLEISNVTNDCWCLGSELSLNTALTKMIDNAIAMTSHGKTVEVTITRHGDRMCLAVADQGSPSSDADLDRVNGELYMFSSDHMVAQNSSAGLNFEIAKGLAKLMGGTLRLVRVDGVGNRAELDLPAADPPGRLAGPAPDFNGVEHAAEAELSSK